MSQRTRSRRDDRAGVILDAAGSVLRRGGARALTIDAVAAQAGLSKGGVLHHYASKDALILALVDRKLEELRAGIAACEAERAGGVAGLALGMIEHLRRSYCEEDEFSRALLLASAENPDALAGYRAFVAERLARFEAAEGPEGVGAALFFSLLGVVMGRTLGFHDLSAVQIEPLLGALERAAQELG
ncbi:TetR/AcrR family transcriptional regulator [Methylobacterium sp. R2-1]|uniref:TetR/AcrR family transcriptional regulator n=1 Tax=Methylobacterium sp. R2-1 TaxID=2587064 RepID=UPI001620D12D|nr:TetR/AcrR family transcriptional regulator [Methylobacterium sp. R2-1]MBB2964941.1 AcrR family transcriptional regulator [Methylobacterium sp. R2-1]